MQNSNETEKLNRAMRYGSKIAEEEIAFEKITNTSEPEIIESAINSYHKTKTKSRYSFLTAGWRFASFPIPSFSIPNPVVVFTRTGIARKLVYALGALLSIPVLGMAASFVVPAQTEAVLSAVYRLAPKSMTEHIAINSECALRQNIKDRNGTSVGYLPNKLNCKYALHKADKVGDLGAQKMLQAVTAVEGEIFGNGVFLNKNAKGIARGLKGLATGQRIGGSNLLQTAIESTSGKPFGLSFVEKLKYVFLVGPHFVAHNLMEPVERVRFAITHAQCARGMLGTNSIFGPPIAGNFCAKIVGEESLDDLNAGQACVLAAIYKKPLAVPGHDASSVHLETYKQQFSSIKTRAKEKCSRKLDEWGLDKSLIDAQIDAISVPNQSVLRKFDFEFSTKLPSANQALIDKGYYSFEEKLDQLTLDSNTQIRISKLGKQFSSKVLPTKIDDQLCNNNKNCSGKKQADVGVTVVEQIGSNLDVLGIYQSRAKLFTGPSNGQTHRSLGSTNKLLLVPLFVDAGIQNVCERPWQGLQNVDGSHGEECEVSSDYISLEQALSESSNLGLADGLLKIPENKLHQYLISLGFDVSEGLSHSELIKAAILGHAVTLSPNEMIKLTAGIAFKSDGIKNPSVFADKSSEEFDFSKIVSIEALRGSILAIKSPALEGGTANAATQILDRNNCRVIAAKTGSSDSKIKDQVRDKLAVIAAKCGERNLVAFSLVGSPDPDIPIGSIQSNAVVSLAANAIVAALK